MGQYLGKSNERLTFRHYLVIFISIIQNIFFACDKGIWYALLHVTDDTGTSKENVCL